MELLHELETADTIGVDYYTESDKNHDGLENVVKATLAFLSEAPKTTAVLLSGDLAEISKKIPGLEVSRTEGRLNKCKAGEHELYIYQAPGKAHNQMSPREMLSMKDSSTRALFELSPYLKAIVSAGSTLAFVTYASQCRDRSEFSAKKIALAAKLPNPFKPEGYTIVLDLGASKESTGEDVINMAILGSELARNYGPRNPKVAMISTYSLDAVTRSRTRLLQRYQRRFHGFNYLQSVPGRAVSGNIKDNPDVLLATEYIGNILLKAMEGFGKQAILLGDMIKEDLLLKTMAYRLIEQIRSWKQLLNPSNHGGAMELGQKILAQKAHGRSDFTAILSMLRNAQGTIGRNPNSNGLELIMRYKGDQGFINENREDLELKYTMKAKDFERPNLCARVYPNGLSGSTVYVYPSFADSFSGKSALYASVFGSIIARKHKMVPKVGIMANGTEEEYKGDKFLQEYHKMMLDYSRNADFEWGGFAEGCDIMSPGKKGLNVIVDQYGAMINSVMDGMVEMGSHVIRKSMEGTGVLDWLCLKGLDLLGNLRRRLEPGREYSMQNDFQMLEMVDREIDPGFKHDTLRIYKG